MGRPWLPYQEHIAAVAGEMVDACRYAYHTIVVTAPRQTAKTTTAYDSMLGRGRRYRDFRARYATHQGTITSKMFEGWFEELERSPFGSQVKLRRSQGTEGVRWRPTSSYFQAFPPRDGALRSQALDAVLVDEAQEHDDISGAAMRRTIRPVFSTRRRAQLWIIFTAGTDDSTYARAYLDAALSGAPGYAVFDYGCPPDVDPVDEALWPTWHPGLAYGLTTIEAMRAALDEDASAFGREYGNLWSRTADRSIDPADWAAVQDPDAAIAGPACFGLDVAADRGSGAVAVADQAGVVELVDQHDGTTWMVARLLALQAAHGHPIACARYGAAGPIVDDLERAGARLLVMGSGDVANAAAGMADAIAQRALRVVPSVALSESVDGVAKRDVADSGGFHWARRTSASNPAPLIAASAARWGAIRNDPPARPVAAAL